MYMYLSLSIYIYYTYMCMYIYIYMYPGTLIVWSRPLVCKAPNHGSKF